MVILIHMKSGKTLKVTGVKDYTFKYKGNEITFIGITYNTFRFGKRLLVETLDLSQIEAIERK